MDTKGKICIIMADMTEDYRDEYIIGIEKQAHRLGYSVYIFSMPLLDSVHLNKEHHVYDLIDYNSYDGVIFFENSFSDQKELSRKIDEQLHQKCTKPVIVLGESLYFKDSLYENNSFGCELLTDHMIEEHHCSLLYFLGGQPGQSSQNDLGFMRSLEKHAIPYTEENLIYGGYWAECGESLAKDIANHVVEIPDAVICQDDTVAFFFIKALAKYGIGVPEEIRVAGYGARNASRNNILSITTFPSNAQYTGRLAMAKLHSLIAECTPPSIAFPKSDIITGMSCGCGDCRPKDIHFQLEQHEKVRMQQIYFRNSQIDEKFLNSKDYEELFSEIKHTSYLLPDKCFLSVSIKEDKDSSHCIFFRGRKWSSLSVSHKSTELFPLRLEKDLESKNYFILPITFNNEFLGHFVIGYKEAMVYNNFTKRYVSRLALALWMLRHKTNTSVDSQSAQPPTAEQPARESGDTPASAVNTASNTIFVSKNNTLHKVLLENILFFETEGRKTMAVTKNGRYEVKSTLGQLEELLAQKNFMRVSKSALVNLTKVISVAPDVDRTLIATFPGKIGIRVSRKNANEFKEKLRLN